MPEAAREETLTFISPLPNEHSRLRLPAACFRALAVMCESCCCPAPAQRQPWLARFWLAICGLCGGHHHYLGRHHHELIACATCNVCGLGVILDELALHSYTMESKRVAGEDGSHARLWVKPSGSRVLEFPGSWWLQKCRIFIRLQAL